MVDRNSSIVLGLGLGLGFSHIPKVSPSPVVEIGKNATFEGENDLYANNSLRLTTLGIFYISFFKLQPSWSTSFDNRISPILCSPIQI